MEHGPISPPQEAPLHHNNIQHLLLLPLPPSPVAFVVLMLMLMLAATLQTKQRRLASRPMLAQVSVIAFVVEMLVIIWFPLPIHHHTRNHIRLLPLYSPHPIIT